MTKAPFGPLMVGHTPFDLRSLDTADTMGSPPLDRPTMNLLSIQSHVAYGHVGNAAAVFPLQRLGVEAWAIHTVQFSNHTGYGAWKGRVFEADMIREVVAGIGERGVLPTCDGVISGYMGGADIGEAILDTVATVRAANGGARYCCDPVIGDVGRGIFVRPGIPEFMRERAVPAADVITPNQFELEFLAGRTTGTCTTPSRPSIICTPSGRPRSWSPRCTPRRRRTTPSTCSPRGRTAASACAPPSCRSRSTAPATPSRPCSSCMCCARVRSRRRCLAPPPRFSASSSAPPRQVRAKS